MRPGKKNQRAAAGSMKLGFSIGAKLVMIITVIVLLSLGAITALVSWLIREDLRITAEDNNFEVNRRSANEADTILSNIYSGALGLIHTINGAGTGSALAAETEEFFFQRSPHIAAVTFSLIGQNARHMINESAFLEWGTDSSLAASYFTGHSGQMLRVAEGETVILNASPDFSRPLLAMFFSWNGGRGCVLFAPDTLSDSFGVGANQSWLINSAGDILLHPDFELVRNGTNVAALDFIRSIRESTDRTKQTLVETDFGVSAADTAQTIVPGFILRIWEEIKRLWNIAAEAVQFAINKSFEYFGGVPPFADNAAPVVKDEQVLQFMAFTKLDTGASIVITSIEYNKVFEGINATTRRNIYLTAAVLFISILIIWFFSKRISIPLRGLARAAVTIEGGQFELDLKPKSRDEIGLLTAGFQKMCKALGIFGRFTNRDIAVRAMRGEIKPGGLAKHATVFFSDIRGFTEMSENFTRVFGNQASDRIVTWLNEYLTKMVECVEKTGGVVDKFIGDAVMAHWGTAYTSGSPRKDAFNCVKAALMMRASLVTMNKKRPPEDPGNPHIRIGCGINTGIVTAGQIGSDLRMEYTVIGDPVNLASRTESLNKPLGTDILITENTWNLLKDCLITEEMPSVTVKGKEKPVRLFAVINITGVAGPQTLDEVRKMLDIEAPDVSKVNLNEDEKKYKIGGMENREEE